MTNPELDDRLGELLVAGGLLAPRALARAREFQDSRRSTLGGALVHLRLVADDRLRIALEELTGVRAVDPSLISVYPDFVERMNQLIPPQVARKLLIFPVQMEVNTIHVCMLNPTDGVTMRSLEALSGCKVQPCVSYETALIAALQQHYAAEGLTIEYEPDHAADVVNTAWRGLLDQPLSVYVDAAVALINRNRDAIVRDPLALDAIIRDPVVIRFVQQILCRAVESDASDIHVEPGANQLRIRLRIDGAMQVMCSLPAATAPAVIGRLKAMADLPTQAASLPLDSRVGYDLALGRSIDLRFSLVPAVTGDTIVLRVLERGSARRSLEQLGVDTESRSAIESATDLPNGLVLVTGPTGSGKSSTLYALLDRLNADEACVVTAEDPVESRVEGVTQVQCHQDGLTFAAALRSFLRQDPDVLMVGEIRDSETADVALKAALTGHLVLSTLHTNDAAGAVLRLINMDLEPFVIASALRLVVAQRLIRRLCGACKRPSVAADQRLLELAALSGVSLPSGTQACERNGCASCGGSGYRGRTGIFEVLRVSERIEELVLARASALEIRDAARAEGMRTLRDAALLRAATGETSIEEVLQHTIATGRGSAEVNPRSPVHV
jgi:type IV pilus assembly protein PilB